MFGEKSSRKDIRKELSAKQNLYRELFHHFFVKKHCLTQVFSRNTPTEKCFKKKHHQLCRDISPPCSSDRDSIPQISWGNIRTKKCGKIQPKHIRWEISTKQNPFRDIILYHVFFSETHLRRNVWRQIPTKRYQKKTLYQTKTLQRTVPPFLCWRNIV